ncbi:CubicO group peptidase, beta-lactamase class C family [Dyella sp. OK004]|uniref:serine hydrolase domain-containing protein n=1 Tax=Dyella sp. OK004 TaxID=1855292 RepID=UPI0008F18C08|nr:serine hydrolase domain-containing protein [Dyella sp. OK004]SFS13009.1 CubicO group peptidase, beta-lactamase class C family [Dyella sp. OK004]
MVSSSRFSSACKLLLGSCLLIAAAHAEDATPARLRGEALDKEVTRLMQAAHVPGLALAVIEDGKIVHLRAYGLRDVEKQLPLTTDTVMYAASITKAAFSYSVMTLVDQHRLDLDASIASLLPKPLPEYAKYADLADDPRWRKITPRMLLSHSAGFANFRYWPPDGSGYDPNGKLKIYVEPGSRFAYSGEGINLMQFVLENGAGINVATLMQKQLFDRFGMRRSSMTWRTDFADNLAIGYDENGKALGHKQRESVRAAGSLDTTINDYAKLLAGMVRGDGLSAKTHTEWLKPEQRIRSVQQFPTLDTATTTDNDGIKLAYALGVAVYQSPQGPAWVKTGHDDGTNNLALCLQKSRDCVLIMSNSSNGEGIYTYLIDAVLGPTCYPWFWENDIPYDHPEWRSPEARKQPHPACEAPQRQSPAP